MKYLQILSDLAKGTYDFFINLPDPATLLYNRPEYSIILANQKHGKRKQALIHFFINPRSNNWCRTH